MKFILMVMILSAETGTTTSVEMQEFGSHKACMTAHKAVTRTCQDIHVDGGQSTMCFVRPEVEAKCLRAK